MGRYWIQLSVVAYICALLYYMLETSKYIGVEEYWMINKYAAFIGASWNFVNNKTRIQWAFVSYFCMLTGGMLLFNIIGLLIGEPDWANGVIYFWVIFSVSSLLGLFLLLSKQWISKI